jgi:hypothetical protein
VPAVAGLVVTLWLAAGAIVAGAATAPGASVPPAAAGADTEKLDTAINDVLQRPEYAWRLAREAPLPELEEEDQPSLWGEFFRDLGRKLKRIASAVARFLDWLERKLSHWFPERESKAADGMGWVSEAQTILFVILAVAACALGLFLLRAWRRRRKARRAAVAAQPVATVAALLRDDVTAEQAPSEEWMRLARELWARGEYRLALRAMFLGALAHLGHEGRLTLARHKSNREYARELERRAHDLPWLLAAFGWNLGLVERVWYGRHEPAAEELDAYRANQDTLLEPGRSPGAAQLPRAEGPA